MSLTSMQKKDNQIVELEIAVGAEELKTATDEVFRTKAKNITVPGFRKGKAPRATIEKLYGEGIFMQDAVDKLYPIAYDAAVEESGIEPVDRANVEMLTLDKETGFTFRAAVTVKPEMKIGKYKGLKADKFITEVTDEQVDEEINRMRERNARIITVEGRPAQNGDAAVIDFEGFVDGVAFDGGKGENYDLVLGSHQFIEGFEEQIIGKNVDEEFDVNVTFPEQYHSEELQGKPATFRVKLREMRAKELPALDDEFAKDVSEFDTLEELRGDLRAKQDEAQKKRADADLENALVGKLIDTLKGEIPACMFENKLNESVQDFAYRLSSQGMQMEQYLQYTGMNMEDFRESFREQAERNVKARLALETLAQAEGFTVTDEEFDAELVRLAGLYNTEVERLRAIFPRKDVEGDIKCTKAVDFLLKNAKITEKKAEKKEKETEAPEAVAADAE